MFAVHLMEENSVCAAWCCVGRYFVVFCAAVAAGKESQNSNALRIESLLPKISKFQLG